MGLAVAQVRLLSLTERKADCEYNISIDSMGKMALTREQSELSQQYYSKLQAKQISYYANGQYNKMSYQYLMGYGSNYMAITSGNYPLKETNNMILADSSGRVVMSDAYANALKQVLGNSIIDSQGRGGTFSVTKIPEIIAKLVPGHDASEFKAIIDGDNVDSDYDAHGVNQMTGEETGTHSTVDNTSSSTQLLQQIVDFYFPIFNAAAANGWTTEYNKDMQNNDDYISDALVTGTMQLVEVNDTGGYDPDASLTYFITAGLVTERTNSDKREEITAWYNAQKELLTEKENWYDIDMRNLSTELEAIKTEMESLQSFINSQVEGVFDWGSA